MPALDIQDSSTDLNIAEEIAVFHSSHCAMLCAEVHVVDLSDSCPAEDDVSELDVLGTLPLRFSELVR